MDNRLLFWGTGASWKKGGTSKVGGKRIGKSECESCGANAVTGDWLSDSSRDRVRQCVAQEGRKIIHTHSQTDTEGNQPAIAPLVNS